MNKRINPYVKNARLDEPCRPLGASPAIPASNNVLIVAKLTDSQLDEIKAILTNSTRDYWAQ